MLLLIKIVLVLAGGFVLGFVEKILHPTHMRAKIIRCVILICQELCCSLSTQGPETNRLRLYLSGFASLGIASISPYARGTYRLLPAQDAYCGWCIVVTGCVSHAVGWIELNRDQLHTMDWL